jgi:hypothetical protein
VRGDEQPCHANPPVDEAYSTNALARAMISPPAQDQDDLARLLAVANGAAIASFFKTSFLAKISEGRHFQALRQTGLGDAVELGVSVAAFYEAAYARLRRSYRCEYVFKNEIVRKLVLARHDPSTSVVISEFAVGVNRMDIVVVNGTTTAYEIKTAYDSLDRLPAQIGAALRVFDRIIVACDPIHVARVTATIDDDRVGILSFTARGAFRTERPWRANAASVNARSTFDCLRAEEYVPAVRALTGCAPIVPNTLTYRTYAPLFAALAPAIAHRVLADALKRRFADPESPAAGRLPASMAHIYYETPRAERARLFRHEALARRLGSRARAVENGRVFSSLQD